MIGRKIRRWPPRSLFQRVTLRRLRTDEDGALMILSIQIFLIMLICTGVAIDLARHENRRTTIQATIDRASLAAASLSQELDPYDVVDDYIEKAGLENLQVHTDVKTGSFGEWRRVTITARDDMPTIFGHLVGMDMLAATGDSQAEESVGNVEISMVLDISGSMSETVYTPSGQRTRMQMLQPAAQNFVTRMFASVQPPGTAEGRLVMSIIPYTQNVSMGSRLAARYKLSTDHGYNTCADVFLNSTTDFAINPQAAMQRTMYGDSFDYWGNNSSAPLGNNILNCQESGMASIFAYSSNETRLTDKIRSLTAGGDTAIDVGARWGLTLLDPISKSVFNGAKDGMNGVSDRPFDYDDGTRDVSDTAMKILVLMTDGQNTRSYTTKPEFRTGGSYLYSVYGNTAPNMGQYDVSSYYSTCRNIGSLLFHTDALGDYYYSVKGNGWTTRQTLNSCGFNLTNITWDRVWAKGYTMQYVIDRWLRPAISNWLGWSGTQIYEYMAQQSEYGDKDSALTALCNAAKRKDIKIFTVAVDAPQEGRSILRSCASGETYYYDVQSADLIDAFSSIASSINALRLTN